MSRFYFHIRYGSAFIPDDQGMDLKDLRAAHAELLASAQDLALAEMRAGRNVGTQTVEIEDADGQMLESISIRPTFH